MARFRQRNLLIDVIVVALYALSAAATGAILVHYMWSASARIYTDDHLAASDVPYLRSLDAALQEQAARYGWEYWHQATHVPLRTLHAIMPLVLAAELRVAEGRAFHALVNGLLMVIEIYKGARGVKQLLFCADEVACRTPSPEIVASVEPSAAFIVDIVVAFAFAGYGLVQLIINAFASRIAATALRREERAYPPAAKPEPAGVAVLVPSGDSSGGAPPGGPDLPPQLRHFLRDSGARRRQQPQPQSVRQAIQQHLLQHNSDPLRPMPLARQYQHPPRRPQAFGRAALSPLGPHMRL